MMPVIVIGMHRSGTSLVSRMLDDAGLFVGRDLQADHESEFFIRLNQFALRTAGAIWTQPWPIMDLVGHDEGRRLVTDYWRRSLAGPRVAKYLGPKGLAPGALARQSRPWGWKDPRNSLTLPLWLDLFPEARVVQVDRHGLDVARSLQVRYDKAWAGGAKWYDRKKPLYHVVAARKPVSRGYRIAELAGGLGMWDDYIRIAEANTANLGDRFMRVRYEDLMESPEQHLPGLLSFCGLDPDGYESAAAMMNPTRAYAYRRKPELVAVAKQHEDLLARHGYHA